MKVILHTYLLMKMEQTGCSETSAYKIQTPGNYPEESIQQKIFGFLGIQSENVVVTLETERTKLSNT